MSPIFNITIILCYIAIIGLFIGLKDQRANIAVIACVFVVYFMYAKKAYRDNMTKIATNSVLDETTGIYIYYLDEDLLEEMRISLFKSIYTFRKSLIQKLNAYQD